MVDDDYIGGWISATGEAPAKLLKGVYNWYVTLEKTTGTKELRVYWKLVERKSDNSETVIATSSNSNLISSKGSYLVPLQLDDDYLPDSGSRIVGKLYADVSGGGSAPTVRLYYQGNTSSRWEIPANSEIFKSIFVPYDGAVKDVDLGSYDLTTTGDITAGNLNISNWDTAYSWGDHSTQNYLDLDTYPNADTDSTDDLTTSTNFSGDVSGTYNNLQLGSGVVTTMEIDDGTITHTDVSSSDSLRKCALHFTIDGGGSAITTGGKAWVRVPYDMTITGWDITADQSGSIVIDVYKDTYANFPPDSSDSIAGTEKPTLSSAQKNQDTSLSSWTTSVSAGDYIKINVDSASTVTKVYLTIYGYKN